MDEKIPENKEEKGTEKESLFKSFRTSLWEFIKFFIVAAVIVVPIRIWVAQPFIVNGSSMVPTYENGEYLIVDEFSYHFRVPQRGEVIIFRYPQDPSKFYIKRIIGLPGEHIQINGEEIIIYNKEFPAGIKISESYIKDSVVWAASTDVKLEDSQYFVLGDNRPMSSDSRIWGALDTELIIGRAWLRLWPFYRIGIVQ